MKVHLSDIRRALKRAEEPLVLGFHHDESASQFELVCEFWDTVAGADRAFVLFRFSGVRRFKRSVGADKRLQEVGATFVARDVRGHWGVQAIETRKDDTLDIISLSFGESHGSLELEYAHATQEVVQLYARRTESDWAYFEVGTDRPVDFYNPFGCPWAVAGTGGSNTS